ncbi:uncharacterized protein AB675_2350 [Cyphellophora attinorum]|uniref:Prion-inhibition and propagation HeLo domain-containing protein n=1 Tax=Cyphellophora attinorum TaxID=1664694 RepID=A0A0N1P2D2_9EURO|nr:uncharacterized protein AB675_2350 [Phialophora attinorum]KPI45354.1 hypothetical protein AB675_2350 [Phialophora attinorum]
MDPIGLSIGLVGLSILATTCLKAFQRVSKIDQDHGVLQARFSVERDRFLMWARTAGVLQEDLRKPILQRPYTDDARIYTNEEILKILMAIAFLTGDCTREKLGTERVMAIDALLADGITRRTKARTPHMKLLERQVAKVVCGTPPPRYGTLEDLWKNPVLSPTERYRLLERNITELTDHIGELEWMTAKPWVRRRPPIEVDIKELLLEPSSHSPTTAKPVGAATESISATDSVVQSVVDNFDRQPGIGVGQARRPPVAFPQRLWESIKEEIRTRPVSVSVASVASMTAVVSIVRSCA